MLNPQLLRTVRESRGLTQTELANQTGLPQADVSRWERQLRVPSPHQVARLAAALGVPTTLLQDTTRPTPPLHRTARIDSKRVERMVNGRLELARLAASKILADIDIATPFAFPSPDDPTPSDPEDAAIAVRRVWRIPPGPIDDLVATVESAGAVVLPVDFGTDSIIAAYSHPRNDYRWCFVNVRTPDGARARFSLAHELGHALLHWDRFDAPEGRDAERDAHRFAAALLMPRDDMLAAFARRVTIRDLIALRQQWKVSMQALVMRAHSLGLLTAHQRTRFFQQISARGWRKAEPGYVEPERPAVVADALAIHREQHGYSTEEIAAAAGLTTDHLADLMPDLFTPARPLRPTLQVIR